MLVVAEGARADRAEYDGALDDLATFVSDDALAELDGADVEYICRHVIDRLRAKAKEARA